MAHISAFALLCALSLASAAAPHALFEETLLPTGWTYKSRAPADHVLELSFALRQGDAAGIEAAVDRISDPYHKDWREHLTHEEAQALARPSSATAEAVHNFFAEHGLAEAAQAGRTAAGDWVRIAVPVAVAEKLLGTEYGVYEADNGVSAIRTLAYSLPEDIHSHIDFVQPTTYFGRYHEEKSTIKPYNIEEGPYNGTPAEQIGNKFGPIITNITTAIGAKFGNHGQGPVAAGCNDTATIACLKALYHVGNYSFSAKSPALGVMGYLEEYANYDDLKTFIGIQSPSTPNATFETVLLSGGLNPQAPSDAGSEANLDIQYTVPAVYPLKTTYYSVGGRPPFNPDAATPTNTNEPYLEMVTYFLGLPDSKLPKVITTSYDDSEQSVPENYARRVCNSFAQLGARGVTLLFSSGDGGVGVSGNSSTSCRTNDGRNQSTFLPLFPSSCPYVTSVGGTVNMPNETAVTRFGSGGGFSNYFKAPKYQKLAIAGYQAQIGNPYPGLYNSSGRGIPDVAAYGDRYQIIVGGKVFKIGGTSASAPTFATIVAGLNDYLAKNGKKPLGFINPWVYGVAAPLGGFFDITQGSSFGCGTPGFPARPGWDAVTGHGSPDFQKLKSFLK